MIVIDGSHGEGGGQILRTALSLAMVTGQPFRIDKIRAGREKPGLLRQHLAAVLAAIEVSKADAVGAHLGSTAITFKPKVIRPGEYHFAVGTAGSGTLVLQTVLPALMTASAPSRLVIEGGTHNTYAPPVDFIEKCFLPLLERMGPKVKIALEKYGFYPAGGGRFTVEIEPTSSLQPLVLEERGTIAPPVVYALIANLKSQIGLRELETAGQLLGLAQEQLRMIQTRDSNGPGNVVMIEVASENVTELVTSFGKVGISAEKVAADAVKQAKAYIDSNAAVGECLADQLLLPMALSGGGSFTTTEISRHAKTNMEIIAKLLPVRFDIEEHDSVQHIGVTQRVS
jgi:RNA 3'-terminal phosphate cyclase (ATP)